MNKVHKQGSTNKVYKQGSTFKNKICSTKSKISTDKNTFQASECYSPTSSQARVLVAQAFVAAYWPRFTVEVFFLQFTQCKKKKKFIPASYVQGQPFPCPQPRIPFFVFTSSGLCKQPVSFEVLAPASLFLQGSHMQREYRKRTTLRSKNQYQQRTTLCTWPWQLQERDAEWSAPTIARLIHGTSVLLGM